MIHDEKTNIIIFSPQRNASLSRQFNNWYAVVFVSRYENQYFYHFILVYHIIWKRSRSSQNNLHISETQYAFPIFKVLRHEIIVPSKAQTLIAFFEDIWIACHYDVRVGVRLDLTIKCEIPEGILDTWEGLLWVFDQQLD